MDRESDDEEARRAMREVMMVSLSRKLVHKAQRIQDVQHSTAEVSSILNDLLIHESRQRLSTIELESLIQTFSSDLPGVLSGLSEEGARQMRGMLMQNEEIWMAQSKSLGDSVRLLLPLDADRRVDQPGLSWRWSFACAPKTSVTAQPVVNQQMLIAQQHQMEADANLLHFRHALEQINGISRRESEALHMNTLAQLVSAALREYADQIE